VLRFPLPILITQTDPHIIIYHPTVKSEIRDYCVNYNKRVENHPNALANHLLTKTNTQRRFKRHTTYDSVFLLLFGFCEDIGTAATLVLLCQPRVIEKMIVEKQMECRLAGETEVLGGNLPQRHFCPSQNPT
jgi:hypothetical protein